MQEIQTIFQLLCIGLECGLTAFLVGIDCRVVENLANKGNQFQ